MAEKGVEVKRYTWVQIMDCFSFDPHPSVRVVLQKVKEKWTMQALLHGKRYVGERTGLREAFSAVNDLLFKHEKEFWLRMDSRVINDAFPDFLKGEL